jgi:manganese transport protein
LVFDQITGWLKSAGEGANLLYLTVVPLTVGMAFFLFFITIKPWMTNLLKKKKVPAISTPSIHKTPVVQEIEAVNPYQRVALALDFGQMDKAVMSHAVAITPAESTLILLHVVESAGAKSLGTEIQDTETVTDIQRLESYAELLRYKGRKVEIKLGYGSSVRGLVELVKESKPDLLILGGHGHGTVKDLLFGATADEVRHRIGIPVLIVRNANP